MRWASENKAGDLPDSRAESGGEVASDSPTGAFRSNVDRHLSAEIRHAWPLDVVNAIAITIGVLSRSVVVWFHIVFLVLAMAALVLPFRRFVVRILVWTVISATMVAWSVVKGYTPRVELSELPLLTAVLVLAYLGAQARGHAVERLTATQDELVHRTENELAALRHQLEQARRLELLGRASQSISHDLRNVFTIVGGCAAELEEQMHGRKGLVQVHEIRNATERGLEIVSDLLLTGRPSPDLDGPVDLGDVTRHLEPLLRRLTGNRVTLEVQSGPEPIAARIDRTSFLQILMNLVVNATEAIDGEGTVTVACNRVLRQRPGGTPRSIAVLTVTDDGPGIGDTDVAQVFEPGFSTKGVDHNGLGLATVWRIASRWGGSIELESTPGHGTSVRVELPLFADRASHRAVVVMHDLRALEVLTDELLARDYEVIAVSDPLEACDRLALTEPVELVIVDEISAGDGSLARVAQFERVRDVVVLGVASTTVSRRVPADREAAKAILDGLIRKESISVTV